MGLDDGLLVGLDAQVRVEADGGDLKQRHAEGPQPLAETGLAGVVRRSWTVDDAVEGIPERGVVIKQSLVVDDGRDADVRVEPGKAFGEPDASPGAEVVGAKKEVAGEVLLRHGGGVQEHDRAHAGQDEVLEDLAGAGGRIHETDSADRQRLLAIPAP